MLLRKLGFFDNLTAKLTYSFLVSQINSSIFKIFKIPYVCLPRIKLDGNVTIGLSKLTASKDVLRPDQSKLSRIMSELI